MSAAPMRGCFVTGTDTEVGKTRVSAALLHWLGERGLRCAGYKPVAAGTESIDGEAVNEDVRALRDAGSVALTNAEVGPCQFEAACAPHIAAALEGRTIERAVLLQGARTLAVQVDQLVVEGVGGFCVPLAPDFDSADFAVDLGLPVLLVVGLRLGCINHALLSAEAIRARGLRLAGWVANTVDAAMLQRDENLATLRHELGRRHQAPCLGVVPRLASPEPAAVAACLDDSALRVLFGLA
ncbi:dethiobiotin synthase [Variovorax sp. J22G21]|uniref:dethiobiotin synthase n=1 Tax=Variovorax fucosicus TaxID=3053517 RepID=UPI002576F6AC|nr:MULTISPECIES: dethiobiotin synthase [unclassified Variovorax]MDM0037510.1 dethiobiotin synthase [Variovorax sp. J22R193]MDM0062286.1 dethiobiotin synthase [Variovorax sp. J22G21]